MIDYGLIAQQQMAAAAARSQAQGLADAWGRTEANMLLLSGSSMILEPLNDEG